MALSPAIIDTFGLMSLRQTLNGDFTVVAGAVNGTTNYPNANQAFFVPIYVPSSITVKKLWTQNGTVVAGNIDLGIYTTAGTLMVSTGSTAQAGTSAIQAIAIADTALSKGTYYLGLAASSTTARVVRMTGTNVSWMRVTGAYEQTTAFPLPNPATFAQLATNFVPMVGICMIGNWP